MTTYKITNSEVQTYKKCKRKWWLAYYRRLRPIQYEAAGPRSLGTRVHEALLCHYSETPTNPFVMLDELLANDQGRLEDQERSDEIPALIKEHELARIMLEGYFDWLEETGADVGIRVIEAEKKLEVPSGIDGISMMGKLDLRIQRESDNARMFLDHKTVGDLTTPVKTLHLDEQMLHYHLLEYLEQLNSGVSEDDIQRSDGGIYNMLRKVKRTATAKPPFYGRVEIRHNVHELRSYWMRVHAVIKDIMSTKLSLDIGVDHRIAAYPTPSRDCSWQCDYFHTCPMFDDGSRAEEMVLQYYTTHDPNERYEDEGTNDE